MIDRRLSIDGISPRTGWDSDAAVAIVLCYAS